MGSLTKISASLESTELKKHKLRKAILVLIDGWKDLEEHLDSTQIPLQEAYDELDCRDKYLSSVQESIFESNKELESIRVSIEQGMETLECKEKEFKEFQEEVMKGFNFKEKGLDLVREAADWEEKLSRLSMKFESERKEFELIQNSVGEKLAEINLKEEQLENRGKILDEFERSLEERSSKLDSKEEQLDGLENRFENRANELDSKEESVELVRNSIEEYKRQLEIKEKQLESLEKSNEQRAKELESRTKYLESNEKFRKKWFKEFRLKKKQLRLTQELLVERSKELDLKENKLVSFAVRKTNQLSIEQKLLEERSKELDSKEKQLALGSSISAEDFVGGCASNHSPSDMDGKCLQIFLNQRAQNLDAMGDEVCRVLRLSLDPARLVLDGLEGFYPPHLKNGDVEFQASVVRSSCILMLEKLILVSCQIRSDIKNEALILACKWKAKMTAGFETSLEVLGFLHLVAAFGNASAFAPHQLLSYVQLIAHCRQAPELCRLLGYVDKIPDLNQKQGQIHSKAIVAHGKTQELQKCGNKQMSSTSDIVGSKPFSEPMAFFLANMDGKYLLHLLNNHFRDHELLRKEVSMALQTTSDSAKLVLNAIKGLYTHYPATAFSDFNANVISSSCILLLEELVRLSPHIHPRVKEEALELALTWTEIIKTKIEDPLQIVCFLKLVCCFGLASGFDSNELVNLLKTISQHRHVNELDELLRLSKRIPENLQLSSTDASSSLGSFCDEKHLDSYKAVKREADNRVDGKTHILLYCASEPTKLVLDALQGFICSGVIVDKKFKPHLMKSLFVLLQQLMKVQGEIKPNIKEEAMKFAAEWKARFVGSKRVSSEILAYLQFLATYRLSTLVKADELINFFNSVCKREEAPDLLMALDLADKLPNLIQNFIKRGQHLLAVKYIYVFDLVGIIPPASILKSHLRSVEELDKKILTNGNNSAEAHARARQTEIQALSSVIGCIEKYGLQVEMPPKNLKQRVRQLQRRPKKRPAPVPVPDVISNDKRPRLQNEIVPANIPHSVSVSNAYSFPSLQAPQQRGQLTVQDGLSLRGPTPQYSLGDSAWPFSSVYCPLHEP